jgi:hypothetical protein
VASALQFAMIEKLAKLKFWRKVSWQSNKFEHLDAQWNIVCTSFLAVRKPRTVQSEGTHGKLTK